MQSKKRVGCIFIIIGIIFVVLILGLYIYFNISQEIVYTRKNQYYIAHGGGMYNGHQKTNSLEAVIHSLNSGIEYIELDLNLTTDNELVALHDWAGFRNITHNELQGDIGMTLTEFKESKIFNEYTPLSGEDIINLLDNNPQMKLVTDKISNPEVINHYFSQHRNRIIVECFTKEDYDSLENMGYLCYLSEVPESRLKYLYNKFINKALSKKYRYVFDIKSLNGLFSWGPLSHYPWEFAIYSCANRKEADSLFNANTNIRFIYIDDVSEIE